MRGSYSVAEGRYLDVAVQDAVFLKVDQGREHALENSGHVFLFYLEEHVVHEVPGATTAAIFQHHLTPVEQHQWLANDESARRRRRAGVPKCCRLWGS